MSSDPPPTYWDRKTAKVPDLSAETISQILAAITSSGRSTVHYTGAADEGLLRALVAHEPKLEVSVMDMPDRWGTGYAFHYDEREFGQNLPRERPEWLEGIPFYQEGASDHEIAIRDWPWGSSDQMDRIIRFSPRRPPPKLWILFGLADMTEVGYEGIGNNGEWERGSMLRPAPFRHPSYEWEKRGAVWIGRWIPDQLPLEPYPEDEEEE